MEEKTDNQRVQFGLSERTFSPATKHHLVISLLDSSQVFVTVPGPHMHSPSHYRQENIPHAVLSVGQHMAN